MSYKSESHQILMGSLNLLPPGDKVPEGDALEATNWRVDQVGMLRSRRGVSLEETPVSTLPVVHSFGRWGTHMYVGKGPSVLRDGTLPSVTDAGDGNPFFFAAMNGSMWIMNRAVQGRDDGTGFYQWGISAPGAPAQVDDQGESATGNLFGSYQWYVTFYNGTTGAESNPSPASLDEITGQSSLDITFGGGANGQGGSAGVLLPISTDPQVTARNLYRSGGTLGQAYQVLTISDNTTVGVTDNLSDADATTLGIAMPIDHDPPPAAAGIAGPYFSRILAWGSAANPNRFWWTKPDQPSFFPGSANPGIGQWADVGDDQEAILRIVCHTRLAIIYKERSIWRLIGDPDTGTLEQTKATLGILGPMAVVNGGSVDYVGTVDGVQKFDFDNLTKLSQRLQPMFQNVVTQIGGIASPAVAIQPINQAAWSTCAMALVNGTLYFAFPDLGNARPSNTLVYHVESDRWGTAVYGGASGSGGFAFASFFYPVNTNDFWGGDYGGIGVLETGTTDGAGVAIWLAWQSAYYNQSFPDNDKVYTSLVIDFAAVSGDRIEVYLYPNNGRDAAVDLGTLVGDGTGRSTMEFSIGDDDSPGLEAKNISVRLESSALGEVVIYSIILYYYVEAREASLVSTIPLDLGSNKVKQFKELQLDIDASEGACEAVFSTDLPDNVIEAQETLEIPMGAGRRNYQLPFTELPCEGRLLQLTVATTAGPYAKFRLYSARVLMRVMGTYIEGHEGWLGFVWDSQEHDFSSALTHIPRGVLIALHSNPIKQSRELELDIETREGVVDVQLLTDLPGNAMTRRFTTTATAPGRRIVRLPLPQAQPTGPGEIEGRLYQLKLASSGTYVLYGARIEILPVGIYLEAYEDAGGAIYDSREQDFGSQKSKDGRELQLDIQTDAGGVTVKLYGDNGTLRFSGTVDTTLTTTGRRKVNLAIATTIPGVDYSRLWQLVITGTNAFRLYNAALRLRAVGHYVTTDAATGAALYDSTELSLGTQSVKEFRMLEVEIQTAGPATVDFWTDLPSNLLNTRQSQVLNTGDRRTVQIPLPQGGVPDNYVLGRLMQLLISSTGGAYALYGARVQYRALPNYFEAYEAAGGAVYDSREVDFGSPDMKDARELGLDIQADGPVTVTLYGDVSGTMTSRFTTSVNTSGQARRKLDLALTASIPGEMDARLWRLVIGSSSSFRLYGAGLKVRAIGHYVDVDAATGAALYDSTELSLGSQNVKEFRLIELELETFGAVTLTFLSDLPGNALTSRQAQTVNTSGVRRTLQVPLPQGAVPDNYTLGRLMQVLISGVSAYKLFGARIQFRALPNFFEAYEAAAGAVYDSRECDFGSEKMKDARELGLDIQADGPVTVTLYGDVSGTMTQRFATTVNTTGQARRKLDLALTAAIPGELDARLWRLVISGANSFRLYGASLRLRAIGHYIDVDAATGSALYDSTELSLGSQNVKEFRLLELELETFGAVTAAFRCDLPGNAVLNQAGGSLNTSGARRTFQIPLPQGAVPDNYMLGRLMQVLIYGTSAYKLFAARIQYRIIGTFIEAYEAAAGAVYDSRECDFGSPKVKDARLLNLDIQADGPVTVTLYGDVSGTMTSRFTTSVNTTGQARRKLDLALTAAIPGELDARLWRLVISGSNSFRLYGAGLKVRAIGHYIGVDAATGSALYDSTQLQLGVQNVKQFRMLELELHTYGPVTVDFWSELPGNKLVSRQVGTVDTTGFGRRTVQIPLPQGAEGFPAGTPLSTNYFYGRLMQLLISGTSAYKLFGARVQYRQVGTYVEAYEAAAGAVWDSGPLDMAGDNVFDQLRLEMDSDSACSVTLWTDLPGETLTERFTLTISTAGFGRRWITMPLPGGAEGDTQGRLLKVVVSSAAAFRLYQGQISKRSVGRYLAAGVTDTYRSLDQNFGTERVKLYKRVEADIQTDGPLYITLYTDGPTPIAQRFQTIINTNGLRIPVRLRLPGNVRGRLARIEIGGASSGRLYGLRAWSKTVGESGTSEWAWVKFPVEDSASLATWSDLPIAPTPSEWTWADLPVEATAAEWTWQEFPVAKTPEEWSWAELPVEPTPPEWKSMPFPVPETPEEWSWADLPVKATAPEWTWQKFPVAETPNEWTWADLPVDQTSPEFQWAKFPVAATPDEWVWAVFPVEETPSEWTWEDVPMGQG